jgi:hypothetical protein
MLRRRSPNETAAVPLEDRSPVVEPGVISGCSPTTCATAFFRPFLSLIDKIHDTKPVNLFFID